MENQIIQINLVPNMSTPAVVRVSQYDVGRPLVFKVYDGTSPADLTGVTAVIEGTKRSGLGFSESGTVSNNTVTLDTTLAMTQEDGSIPAEIRFTKTGEDVGTANFILSVEPSPHPEGTTDGTHETMADLQSQLDALDERVEVLEGGGSGLSQTEKNLILTLFGKAAYAESDAETAYDALEALWTSSTKTITYTLSHVTSSNTATSIESGQSYTTTLTADTNYTLNSVTVTMGGVDVTSTTYSSGTVSIPSVTGDIVITATAVLAVQSITATYTQGGTVYDTDSLDSLKADLVVTANYSGGTSETVPSSDYTLSGTLTEGTSTVTVSYAGLTDTFTVTVTHAIAAIYNWDFTSSLTDSVAGKTATISSECTRTSNGVEMASNGHGAIQLLDTTLDIADKTIIIDIPSLSENASTTHGRLFASKSGTGTDTTSGAAVLMCWRASGTKGWTVYSGSAWGTGLNTTTYPSDFFNNKRLKLYVGSDLKVKVSYADIGSGNFTVITTFATAMASAYQNGYIIIGGATASNYLVATISAVKIYEGEV